MLDEINKYIEKSEPDACYMGHLMLSLKLPCHWIKYLKWLFNKALMWSERSLPVIAVVFDQDIMTQLLVFAILICSCWGFPVGKIWISFDTDHWIFYLIFWFFLLLSLSLPIKFSTIKVMRTWFSTFYMFLFRWSDIQSGHLTSPGWSQPSEGQPERRLGETPRARWTSSRYHCRTPHWPHQDCLQEYQEIPGQTQLLHGYPGPSRRWRQCCRSGYLEKLLFFVAFLIWILGDTAY